MADEYGLEMVGVVNPRRYVKPSPGGLLCIPQALMGGLCPDLIIIRTDLV